MKKKIYIIIVFAFLFSLTGCGEIEQLVCTQVDSNLNVTHEITIDYKNRNATKFTNSFIFENSDAAKQIEAYENFGVSKNGLKRKDNVLYQEIDASDYYDIYGRYLRKKVEEKKYYENRGYTCE